MPCETVDMKRLAQFVFSLLCVLLLLPASAMAKPKGKRILFFTRSQGFEHSVVKMGKDEQPFALGVLTALGTPNGWEIVHTKDGGFITKETLATFDAVIFLTTGDLTELRKDKDGKPLPADDINQLPMTAEGKVALLEAVEKGLGFLSLHNGADTFHSPGNRWEAQTGEAVDPFIAMLGGEFISHGEQQSAPVRVVDKRFPGFGDVGDTFALKEEWYSLKNQPDDLHALLVIDPATMTGDMYERPPFPVAWVRKHGKGRVFYTALGHREDVWTLPAFQKMLLGGLKFVLGLAPGDTRPNLKMVAPRTHELPQKRAKS